MTNLRLLGLVCLLLVVVATSACRNTTSDSCFGYPSGAIEIEGECVAPDAGADAGGCTGCEPPTPFCDTARNACVMCLGDEDCTGDRTRCNTFTGMCVECLEATDCGSPDAPRCDLTSDECTTCLSHSDCTRLTDTPLCDMESGHCIECTLETETERCGKNSCDPATNTCTDTARASIGRCGACLSDSECSNEDDRCVAMEFMGELRPGGGFCLKQSKAGCVRPYSVETPDRVSLSGEHEQTYCGIDETTTTCEGVRALLDDVECTSDASCGASDLDDGICRQVSSLPNRCTYRCVRAANCTGDLSCGGDKEAMYCGGPT